jgi:hypothetical protein
VRSAGATAGDRRHTPPAGRVSIAATEGRNWSMSDPNDYPHTPRSLHGSPVDFGYYLHGLARQDVFDDAIERMLAMYRYWKGGEKSLSPFLTAEPSIEHHMYGLDDLGLVAAFTWPEYDDSPQPYSLNELGKRSASDVHTVFHGRLARFVPWPKSAAWTTPPCGGEQTL